MEGKDSKDLVLGRSPWWIVKSLKGQLECLPTIGAAVRGDLGP